MTSRQRHKKVVESYKSLNRVLNTKKFQYLEQISKIINKAVRHHDDHKLWLESYKKIVEIFYTALTESYLETISILRDTYGDLSDQIPKIDDLLYKKDKKTLPERIKGYWDEGGLLLQTQHSLNSSIALHLLNMLERILATEIKHLSNKLKQEKLLPIPGCVEVVTITDGQCCSHGGTYLLSEISDEDLPPYHPNCQCDYWIDLYDPTDEYDLQILLDLGWEGTEE